MGKYIFEISFTMPEILRFEEIYPITYIGSYSVMSLPGYHTLVSEFDV